MILVLGLITYRECSNEERYGKDDDVGSMY